MGFLKQLASFFQPRTPKRDFYFYIRCDHCGEVLRGRVDLLNDLSVEYDDKGSPASYFTRKGLVGAKGCYRPIQVELTFDRNRQLVGQEAKGGKFVEETDYLAQKEKA